MIRLRLRELLEERGLTAYALARDADGAITDQLVYRVLKSDGNVKQFISAALVESACKVLGCTPGDLIEIVPDPAPQKKKSVKKPSR